MASLITLTQLLPTVPPPINQGKVVDVGSQLEVKIEVINSPVTTIIKVLPERSVTELIDEIAARYGVDPAMAMKIARCESALKQFTDSSQVLRGRQNPADVGLFQINEKYHLGASQKQGLNIYESEGNVTYAMRLIARDGTRHWRYSQHCWDKA